MCKSKYKDYFLGNIVMKINKTGNRGNIRYFEKNYGKNILPLSMSQNEYMPGSRPLEILFFWKRESPYEEGKESLLKTIKHYNLFSSCLIMVEDNKFALQYCTDGVKINLLPPINDTFDSVNVNDIKNRMIHVKTLPGESLFAVTFVPVKDGTFVGISCSDAVADVFSLILFLFAWKCIIEGSDDFPLPSPQRLFKGKPISSDKIDKAFIPHLLELSNKIKNRVKSNEVRTYIKKEYFTDELLNEIKSKVRLIFINELWSMVE